MIENTINTGIKFFGIRVLLESTGDKEIDKAAKEAFGFGYWMASLPVSRPCIRKMIEWSKRSRNKGQEGLFTMESLKL